MSKKLLEDPKVAKLVEKSSAQAVKEDRRRILDGVKDLKAEVGEEEVPAIRRAQTGVITEVNKIIRDAA